MVAVISVDIALVSERVKAGIKMAADSFLYYLPLILLVHQLISCMMTCIKHFLCTYLTGNRTRQ